MSNEQKDAYWDLMDKFMTMANDCMDELSPGEISSVLLNASARFGAFYLAVSSESKKDLMEDKDEALRDISAEYKRCLAENIEDYIENYKVYLRSEES